MEGMNNCLRLSGMILLHTFNELDRATSGYTSFDAPDGQALTSPALGIA